MRLSILGCGLAPLAGPKSTAVWARLLMWPRGAPGAAVVGELGWPPMSIEVRRLQLSLFGRLSAAGGTDDGRTLASRVIKLCSACATFLGS